MAEFLFRRRSVWEHRWSERLIADNTEIAERRERKNNALNQKKIEWGTRI